MQLIQHNKRSHHLRVPVNEAEKEIIQSLAKEAGMSVANYLREVGQVNTIRSVVDLQAVRDLAKINGDLGRLGGLLKVWLSNDERLQDFDANTLIRLLDLISETQHQMTQIMRKIVTLGSGGES